MKEKPIEGKCFVCDETYTKQGMTLHLKSCLKEEKKKVGKGQGKAAKHLHLSLSSVERPDFWMHLEITGASKLSHLDSYLRDIWFPFDETHLSGFEIDDSHYNSYAERAGINDMNQKLYTVLKPGKEFLYKYDFGTTSRVEIKVISRYKKLLEDRIKLLARNLHPERYDKNTPRDGVY